jgi:hypothetical protein
MIDRFKERCEKLFDSGLTALSRIVKALFRGLWVTLRWLLFLSLLTFVPMLLLWALAYVANIELFVSLKRTYIFWLYKDEVAAVSEQIEEVKGRVDAVKSEIMEAKKVNAELQKRVADQVEKPGLRSWVRKYLLKTLFAAVVWSEVDSDSSSGGSSGRRDD